MSSRFAIAAAWCLCWCLGTSAAVAEPTTTSASDEPGAPPSSAAAPAALVSPTTDDGAPAAVPPSPSPDPAPPSADGTSAPDPAAPASAAPVPEPEPEEAADAEARTDFVTRTSLTTREAPGVVSVVQREEIERSGARDLADILHLVPGFSLGIDVEGVVGVSFRGIWGHEGKVLFLLDGQELNEGLYATTPMGMHIPASVIDRVEVIRGPGAVVYGGYAEIAVVNIVTRDARTLNGGAGSLSYGQMGRGFGFFDASASYAGSFARAHGLTVSTHLAYTEGVRSDRAYSDFAGKSYDMAADSHHGGLLADLGVAWQGLRLRLVYDDHHIDSRDGTVSVLDITSHQRFESLLAEVRYEARLLPTLTLTPRIAYKRQTSWQDTDPNSELFYDKTVDRLLGGLQLSWSPHRLVDILLGAEGFLDHGSVNNPLVVGLQSLFADNRLTINYGNAAGYAQLVFRNIVANITVGARYEYHTQFGSSFVPRVALTRVLGRFHVKLLYSQAFRAPAIENLNINPDLLPERTNVFEGELGVQLSGHLAITANAFFQRIDKPIVYDFDPTTMAERYINGDRSGTVGAEGQLRARYAWGYLNLGYSFYRVAEQNRVALFAVPGNDTVLLGTPAHKGTLSTAVNVWREHVVLGATAVVMSPRHGYVKGDVDGNPVIGEEPTLVLLGATLTYRGLGMRGLDLALGVRNLLDQSYRLLQPYNGGHAPLPYVGREVMLRLSYGAPPPE